MSMDDILLNKAAIVERCLKRVDEEQDACLELDKGGRLLWIINVD